MGIISIVVWVGSASAEPPRGPDLNGDGWEDLVIGIPSEGVNGYMEVGSVLFLYGSATGLGPLAGVRDDLWQDQSGILGASYHHEDFGQSLVWGDFDGDCFDDVLVGVPGTILDQDYNEGLAQVFYGSSTGVGTDDASFYPGYASVGGVVNERMAFSYALAAGDFDGDGYEDAAIGAPGEHVPGLSMALPYIGPGVVHVIYGSWVGLSATEHRADQTFSQQTSGVPGVGRALNGFDWDDGESFGAALASGDFDCDGYADLAVGTLHDDVPGSTDAGTVTVLYGSAAGLSATATRPSHRFYPGVGSVDGISSGTFGARLVVGNFDGNSVDGLACDDLAIGDYDETVSGITRAGAVHVLYGGANGLQSTSPADGLFTRSSGGITGSATSFDRFGWALAVGRFDGDAYDDLAVGLDWPDEGGVQILRGSATGLTTNATVQWTLGTFGGTPDYQDMLGRGLSAGDFDGDGRGELVVGMPGGDAGAVFNPGRVYEVHTADTPSLYDWYRVFLQEDIATVVSEELDEMGHSFAPSRSKPLACTPVVGGPGGFAP